ncbi:MAG: single-stranded DNA-binding protein [Flavobacteriaceae bacterium]|nr:single-stranded DNA-binding protein [Flavobacteriaceae bacterium]|tara:strand:+ start:7682 stop:8254 length:573 start_codon:yes stop_codon:yes gene_type:complete
MARGSINKVIIIGTLGRDPEIRYLPNGSAVCSMSLATDEGYKDRNTGQQVDKTEWHRIEAFGRLAEIMGEYLKKGAKCYVEGKLRTDEYEKDGIKRYSTKIIANEMTMLDSRQGADSQGAYQPSHQPQPSQSQPQRPAQQAPAAVPAQTPAEQALNHAPAAPYGQAQPAQQAPAPQPSNAFDDFDDDIPF